MRYFDLGNSVKLDPCAQAALDQENLSILNYNTMNYFVMDGDCIGTSKRLEEIALEYPNIRIKNGFGQGNACTIDTDSSFKNTSLTHGPERQQLFARMFMAGPNLSRGPGAPQIEQMIQQGIDTTIERECGYLTEFDYNRFTPLQGCVSEFINNFGSSLPSVPQIGVNSRDIVRQSDFINKCRFYKKENNI